jgi:hypothetical protein
MHVTQNLYYSVRRLKNSKPRMIGVCEGVRAKSTSM